MFKPTWHDRPGFVRDENPYSNKIVIMDEAHNLCPPKNTRLTAMQKECLERLRARLVEAKNTVRMCKRAVWTCVSSTKYLVRWQGIPLST